FEGFLHRLGELELSVSLDAFHTLFTLRCVPHESFFYFYPRAGCRFLDSGPSNHGPWRERFFYVQDKGWGVPTEWSSSAYKIHLSDSHTTFQLQCCASSLFDSLFN
ncbi:hypothetical protein Pfo_015191, partial [Paulownia fortunei]